MNEVQLIQSIQEYIRENFQKDECTAELICSTFGYSKRHMDRLFKKHLGKTLQKYIQSVRLSQSAQDILSLDQTIIDIAFQSQYLTHEGFARSFKRMFQITPSDYRESQVTIPLFIEYPISHYYAMIQYEEEKCMNETIAVCTVTPVAKTERKLIFQPSRKAKDYFTYCEEMGCEWEGLLNSIPEKLDTAALIELPDGLREEGFSAIASGIEVPLNFDKPLPEGYKTAILDNCTMLYFQSEPYEKDEDFCIAIDSTYRAIRQYDPSSFGYQYDYSSAPTFNYGADSSAGARIAVPVKKVE